jgi:hypothetical protein
MGPDPLDTTTGPPPLHTAPNPGAWPQATAAAGVAKLTLACKLTPAEHPTATQVADHWLLLSGTTALMSGVTRDISGSAWCHHLHGTSPIMEM